MATSPSPKPDARLEALKSKEKFLEEKLGRLKSGEIKCEQAPGDGRQEEAIQRSEFFLREIRKEIKDHTEPKAAKKEGK